MDVKSQKTKDLIGRFKAGSNVYWDLVFRIGSLNYWFSKN